MACVASGNAAARPLLNAGALREALVAPGGLWRDIRVVAETGSTNSDLLAEARGGLAEGAVLAAETQSAGRGRMGRHWVSPPRAALAFSVLLRPKDVPRRAAAGCRCWPEWPWCGRCALRQRSTPG